MEVQGTRTAPRAHGQTASGLLGAQRAEGSRDGLVRDRTEETQQVYKTIATNGVAQTAPVTAWKIGLLKLQRYSGEISLAGQGLTDATVWK
jgi:hypothetical protein